MGKGRWAQKALSPLVSRNAYADTGPHPKKHKSSSLARAMQGHLRRFHRLTRQCAC